MTQLEPTFSTEIVKFAIILCIPPNCVCSGFSVWGLCYNAFLPMYPKNLITKLNSVLFCICTNELITWMQSKWNCFCIILLPYMISIQKFVTLGSLYTPHWGYLKVVWQEESVSSCGLMWAIVFYCNLHTFTAKGITLH